MSDSSDEGDQGKAGSTSRKWVESQPGPSSRQGYCGYCRVLYSDLDQHLSSLRHLDAVRASSRGSSVSSTSSSRSKLTLLERFLQDVLQHHPHHYNDPRPSHADLPSVAAPPCLRAELDDVSCQPANQKEEGASQERLSAPIREQEEGGTAPRGHIHSSHAQTPPPVHRKAHRKTNRRKFSDSFTSLPPPTDSAPPPHTDPAPWLSWPQERRAGLKAEAFSSDRSHSLDRIIEEVIQMCCHGDRSTDSFHLSLPVSVETQSDDWDSPVQRGFCDTPVQVSPADLSHLTDVQVHLEHQLYSAQLDSALHSERPAGGGVRRDEGFQTLPIEEVLPAPEHIPESFRGKSWTQIEQEDEEKVEKLVRQFRQGRFICYFDSESLARYGRKSQIQKGLVKNKEVESDTGVLPLLDSDDDDSAYVRRRRRGFRVASRCQVSTDKFQYLHKVKCLRHLCLFLQVVKVSHSTQTVRLVIPAVRQPASEAPPTSVPAANQAAVEQTPVAPTWRCLPPSYSNIVTPLQQRTSLVYLLCSPSGSAYTPAPGSAHKRCRKKRRPLDPQGLKVKYKQLPFRFYNPSSNRILKNPPKGFLWQRGSVPSIPPPPCVRQLFRSLSPDLNTDRPAMEGATGSSRVKDQRSPDPPFSHANSMLSRDSVRRRGRTSEAPPSPPHTRSERVRGGRTRPPPSKRRTRSQATPPHSRREGLRRAGPDRKIPGSTGQPHPPSPRRGRSQKGRSCERGRR
ncbi:DBF4-type zinc finger-containing protein 2 isoform X2 [Cottoperca gobio]|nr:DBF4-type zinc finger-containing protein 2 isoform X2 [Cottoperca gobio]